MTSTQPTVAAVVREKTGVAWSRARKLCMDGRVTVDGQRCLDPATRISPDAVVVVNEHAPKVERRGRFSEMRSSITTAMSSS